MLDRLRKLVSNSSSASAQAEPIPAPVIPETPLPKKEPVALSPTYDVEAFDAMLDRISSGEKIKASELLPFLCASLKSDRAVVNLFLSKSYAELGDLQKAKTFVARAWLLSDFSIDFLPAFVRIHEALADSAAIREAYKRFGMKCLKLKDVSAALFYFDQWHRVDSLLFCTDSYVYDFDIIDALERAAIPYRAHLEGVSKVGRSNEKIRIGYLLRGITDAGSILIKIILTLAKFHDRQKFEVFAFCPETSAEISSSTQAQSAIAQFESFGVKMFSTPGITNADTTQLRIETAKQIRAADVDVLVTSAALADFGQYFITCLKPAPKVVGLVQGPPSQFASPMFDWCISWSQHPQIDTPSDCSVVQFSREDPTRDAVLSLTREDLELPADACVLVSSGRAAKFQSLEHWHAVTKVLKRHANTHYVLAGTTRESIQCFEEAVSDSVKSRVHFLGWIEDVPSVLKLGDILVDTYPSGGGQSLVEGMLCGLPVVAHRNDYFATFDQNNWSPIEDFVGELETVVERGDFNKFAETLSRLIQNVQYRKQIADECYARVQSMASEDFVIGAVRECEEIFSRVRNS